MKKNRTGPDTDDSLQHPIVMFDGVCNFCNSSVEFIIRRDPRGLFHFTALQSDAARSLLANRELNTSESDSILLLENGQLYSSSTAALRIARRLKGWPRLTSVFLIVPSVLRDPLYRLLARNRYRWFGKQDACMLPSPDVRARFLG
ncbi:MAG: thiol-disulfide oxidoreductase [Paenibacillus sp.]|nr:thiol-disulfide oxidoreductase [Paenibacillus sp.]